VNPLAGLRALTQDAIDDLAAVRCADPAAADAMQAVKLTARTLRSFWVPALDVGRGAGGGDPDAAA
jgi:hypothetical protein